MSCAPTPESQRIRAIAVSAYARSEDKKRALAAGFDGTRVETESDELMDAIERSGSKPSALERCR